MESRGGAFRQVKQGEGRQRRVKQGRGRQGRERGRERKGRGSEKRRRRVFQIINYLAQLKTIVEDFSKKKPIRFLSLAVASAR